MCCTRLAEKQDAKNRHLRIICITLSGGIFATKAYIDNRKKNLLNSNISSTCPHNMVNFGSLTAEIGLPVWGTQQISTDFVSCLRYCSDVARRRPAKLCTMFGRLLGWYTIYLTRCKIHLTFKSCVLLYWQHYCTALQEWASAILCGVVQGIELRNLRRGRHLYSTGRPSRSASAHILVTKILSSTNSAINLKYAKWSPHLKCVATLT